MSAVAPAAERRSPLDRLDDRCKLLCLLAFVLAALLTPPGSWWRFGALWALLLVVVGAARIPLGLLARRVLATMPIMVPLAISLVLMPGRDDAVGRPWVHAVSIVCGAALSVSSVTALATHMGFARLLAALSSLRMPRILIALLAMTDRYVHVLGDEAVRMVRARDSRGRQARVRARAHTAGAMVGSLLVRSTDRADRVASAMAARGFAGDIPMLARGRLSVWDGVACAAFSALCAAIVWWPLA
jgi:cobalt/nickel transport system permease protein